MESSIHTVSELLNILKNYQNQFIGGHHRNAFVFRGMSNKKWFLLPGKFREFTESQNSSTVEENSIEGEIYHSDENEIIAHFKKEASGFLPHISQEDNFTWLQYAQHFGVPTRLLDFTSNPLIALYFCCKSESNTEGSIYIINTTSFQTWSGDEFFCSNLGLECTREAMINSIMNGISGYSDYDEERLEKQRPVFFIPPYIDQRMSAQLSCFLLWGKNKNSLEMMAKKENKMNINSHGIAVKKSNDQRFLSKIVVSSKSKHHIMKELDLLGINEKTMFPGLDGIGSYIEHYYRKNVEDMYNFL